MIPYGKHNISEEDISAVVDVLRSDFLTQGPKVPQFEETISKYCGCKYAVAVNSATSALHIACLSLGLEAGDWLWTSPNTFVATANCGLFCGAQIDFVDIDPITCNISISSLEEKLIKAKKRGRLPKVVVPVHFAGQPCEMDKIKRLSEIYGFNIIEDASHSIGARYKGKNVGNCEFSDITVFSFHPVKIITCGEGGLALTNSKELNNRMNLYRNHGITRDEELMTKGLNASWNYEQITLGYNFRMTELNAALGISQLKRLNKFVQKRHELANRYDKLLNDLPAGLPYRHPDNYSSFHLYVISLQLDKVRIANRTVVEKLRNAGIGVTVHYIPVHTHPYYQGIGFQIGDFPNAEEHYKTAISLPLFYDLSFEKQDFIVQKLKEIIL
jgi:UDP-4-amino-4,6-dideoxy-N-acetyl-beta-L-altrosamine transaminase